MDYIKINNLKTNRNYVCFISALKGAKVRLIRNSAFFNVKQLSSVLEDVVLKLTINDDKTIDVEQTEGIYCDKEQLERIVKSFDEYEQAPYAQKYVISELTFIDSNGDMCYIEVEHKRPIDRFMDLLEEFEKEESETNSKIEETVKNSKNDLSSLIDQLFVEEDLVIEENKVLEKEELLTTESSYLNNLFEETKNKQKEALKKRIEEKEKEILKAKLEIDSTNKKISKLESELELLLSRVSSMEVFENSCGFTFAVSQQINIPIEITEQETHLVEAIAKNLRIGLDKFKELVTKPSYKILLKAKDENIKYSEIYEKIYSIDINATYELEEDNIIIYKGNLNWHQLVDGMIRKGFEQDPSLDRELEEKITQ